VVQVAGVHRMGLDMGVLEDAACPSETTWVELTLQSARNKEKLRHLLDRMGKAYVIFQGDFYGPGVAAPSYLKRSVGLMILGGGIWEHSERSSLSMLFAVSVLFAPANR